MSRDASSKDVQLYRSAVNLNHSRQLQVENFKKYDIEVKGKTIAGRMFPETYSYKGGDALSPREFADLLKTNELARVDFKAAVNMRYLGFKDFVYKRWTMSRFGISEAAAKLTGATEEERGKQLCPRRSLKKQLNCPNSSRQEPMTTATPLYSRGRHRRPAALLYGWLGRNYEAAGNSLSRG